MHESASNQSKQKTKSLDPHTAEVEYKGFYKSVVRRTVSIPTKLHGFVLLQCMIRYLQVKSSEGCFDLYKFVTRTQNLINYLNDNYENYKSIAGNILQNYANYLSDVEEQTTASIRTHMANYSVMLRWSIDQPWFQKLAEKDRIFVLSAYQKKPVIPKNSILDGTAPAMSELVKSKEYDDRDLLDSLIRFCFGFLLIFKRHRDLVTSNRRVKARLALAKSSKEPDIDWRFLHPNWDDYNEIFNAIVDSRDATLLERLLVSNQRFHSVIISAQNPSTLEELYTKLKTCVREVGSICFTHLLNDETQYVTFEQLDIRSLLSPCEAEEICIRWLLAIDRIQQIGQKELNIQDIEVTPTHLVITFSKRRSSESLRSSMSHKRKTFNYKLLSYVLELRKDFEERFGATEADERKFFQFDSPFARSQNHFSITFRPIILACTPGNNLYEEICSMFPRAKLFQEYFCELIDQNTTAHCNADKNQKVQNKRKPDTNSPLTRKLTANVVAQSRAIIDPEELTTRTPSHRSIRAEMAADGNAHSVKTSREIYKNRSQTAHRLNRRSKFVGAVGKLQEEDARKITALMEITNILTIEEVNDSLGWDVSSFKAKDIDDFNLLVAKAESNGYNCAPFGWLSKSLSMERIIIVTPVTAALILSFIKGCQNELKRSESVARSHAVIMQLCYANMVLKLFDKRTIADGREMLQEYDFPPAVI
ncbi:hypothetical protein WKQ99_17845 [Pseudomonas atacamensis]|uniref:hypothetical protein n=1 Tax=Pseudomonas atacamensis TaxID=2565368 RepID=UPI0030CD9937